MTDSRALWADIPREYNAVVDFVDRNVDEGRGDKAAFIDTYETMTYGQLQTRSFQFANGLSGLNIAAEQRVALIMLDTVALPVAFWGAIRAGIVPILMNTLLNGEQYRYMLKDSGAVTLVISAALFATVEPILSDLPALKTIIISDGDAGPHVDFQKLVETSSIEFQTYDTCADATAFWLYSSGSTGAPKGVKHLHSSLMQTAVLYGQHVLGIREDDLVYSAAKLFFAYGLGNGMTFPMSVGATALLLGVRPTPDVIMALLKKHNPTLFFAVPTLFAAMLAHDDIAIGAGSDALRMCVSAGEALPEDVGKRWLKTVGTDILDGIGSTEMLHIFVSNRPDDITYGATGRPVPGYDARLVDENGKDVPDGDIGELIVSGPSAGEGYWNQRDKTRATFVGEWTYTGDKYRREDGDLYFYCGRTDDMFKVSGNWVSPFDVESALSSHNAVLESAVVGREDDDGLIKPMAFVVLKDDIVSDDALFEELKQHVKDTAGPWKYPRWIEVRQDLPKTATGKIQRFKLRENL